MFPDIKHKNIHGLWDGISTVLKILEHLWFKEEGG
jgi:hypothetical protein